MTNTVVTIIVTGVNRLETSKRVFVISALVEGNSINAIVRMTGVAKHTVLKLLADVGCTAAAYHDAHIHNVRVRHVQVDEAWAFCYAKQRNLPFARCVFRSNVITDSGGR